MINFYHKETAATTFASLEPGDIFRKPSSAEDFCYLKTCTGDAVNLITGYYFYWNPKDKVIPIPNTIPYTNSLTINFKAYFDDISLGETFTIDATFASFYIKTPISENKENAINLVTGEAYHFDGKQSIKILYIDIED